MSIRVRVVANSLTQAVNENVEAVIKVSDGYDIIAGGKQVPKYIEHATKLQLQSMESDDLEHFGFGNQQGLFMVGYTNGMIEGLDRDDEKGNSIVETNKYGSTKVSLWQVMKVAESYNDWCKIIIRHMGYK